MPSSSTQVISSDSFPMIAQLIPVDGSKPFLITRDVTLVGRKPGLCDIVLPHNSVSKLHCAIARTDGLLFIRDLGSTNGTKVNGQRVTRGALLPGDELSFASAKFRVHLGPNLAPPGIHTAHTEELDRSSLDAHIDENSGFEFVPHGDSLR